uniref:Lcc2 n=1 Tax=Fusarium oxysporum (strain Fo5176) TaxID=660025 RepID=A0A0C4DHY1_FUSOF
MWITDACKAVVLSFVAVFHYPSVSDEGPHQDVMTFTHGHSTPKIDYPYFDSPSGPDQDGKVFTCNYTDLKGWKPCTTADDRSCWLKGPYGQNFTINTDYENFWPIGITREYHLNVTDQSINGDGVDNPFGKVFNGKYPGPWIQACWGDLIKVTVHNHLKYNGTTIHWHGLRQLETFEMDGVNGVTQCPIAPGDSYTYTFRAVQYGTSWYHSHYSLQYADGLAGPITIYGPSSAPFDEGRNPILITDWSHRSAFQSWQRELVPNPTRPMMNGVLINGVGNFAGSFPRERFNMTVTKGRKYVLRVINTSVDTTWIFSIDNHNFTVMSTDFVPIHPYSVSHIVLGIGQRYHIVLDANPTNTTKMPANPDGNYWIRTVGATRCKGFEPGNEPDERQGILRYNASSKLVPTTFREDYSLECRDEAYDRLSPVYEWNVDPVKINYTKSQFDIGLAKFAHRPELMDNFTWWAFGENPLWLNFSNPTILNLKNTTWNPDYAVDLVVPDSKKDKWVYIAITAPPAPIQTKPNRAFAPVAHPILEQQTLLNRILDQYPEKMKEVNRVCDNWNKWFKNDTNLWNAHIFQDDSGI